MNNVNNYSTNMNNKMIFGETNWHNIRNIFIMTFYYGQNYDNYGNSFQIILVSGKELERIGNN